MDDVISAVRRAAVSRVRRLIIVGSVAIGSLVAAAVALGLKPADRNLVTVVGVVVLVISVPVPFLGALLASDVLRSPRTFRPLPTLMGALLVAVSFGLLAFLLGVAAVAVLGFEGDPWRNAVMMASGAVLVMVMSQLVGVGMGLVFSRPWLACAATIVLPLGLSVALGAIPGLTSAQGWVVPVVSAQHLLSGQMTELSWAQFGVVLLLWGRGLYALGTLRLGWRGELVPVWAPPKE